MRLRFSDYQDSPPRKRVKPPPDYFSRRVQLRVMMLVAALMFVVLMMLEVRKPEFWRWMEFPPQAADDKELSPGANDGAAGEGASQDGDSAGGDTADAKSTDADSADSVTAGVNPSHRDSLLHVDLKNPLREQEAASDAKATPLDRAWRDGWRHIAAQLDRDNRDVLCRALLAARRRIALADDDLPRWPGALFALDGAWHRYVADASHSIVLGNAAMSDEQRDRWLTLLKQLESRWSSESRPAIEEAVAGRPLDAAQHQHLAWVQSILDTSAMSKVQDNTLFRADETEAWFRLLEILRTARPGEIASASMGAVSDRELTDRPDDYRGRLVTIRGVAHLAYRVPAPDNPLGVREYAVLWIKPERRDGVPLTAYVLEPPPGFPPLALEGQQRSREPLDEPVELTGYFFKIRAYASNEGVSTAPVVVARSFRSTRQPTVPTPGSEFSWSGVAWAVAAALLVAGLVITWVIRFGGRGDGNRSADADDDRAVASLGDAIESAGSWPSDAPGSSSHSP